MTKLTGIQIVFFLALTACGGKNSSNNASELSSEDRARVQFELGKFLFHDKLLSGNQNIACSTCHHVLTGTTDGLSLPVGEGGCGLGIARTTQCGIRVPERVPRNSPALFNLGEPEFSVMFADGRVSGKDGVFQSPAGQSLPRGLTSALAVQALFPITSGTEMAGQRGENFQAELAFREDFVGVWDHVVQKLIRVPEYVQMFREAFALPSARSITIVHVANAIAIYEAQAFSAKDSPYDRYLAGDVDAMSPNQIAGMNLFSTTAGCTRCHSGAYQTDHSFRSVASPQIGPGKGDGFAGLEDFGRERVTKNIRDRYSFRVPSLRNVALTGPWFHAGSYNDLRSAVMHHLNPREALDNWSVQHAVLPWDNNFEYDFYVHGSVQTRDQIKASADIFKRSLSDTDVDRLIDFLHALTDPASLDMREHMPIRVPSGLPLND